MNRNMGPGEPWTSIVARDEAQYQRIANLTAENEALRKVARAARRVYYNALDGDPGGYLIGDLDMERLRASLLALPPQADSEGPPQ